MDAFSSNPSESFWEFGTCISHPFQSDMASMYQSPSETEIQAREQLTSLGLPYRYPTSISVGQIRLLRSTRCDSPAPYSSSSSQSLGFFLGVHDLISAPEFAALSYEWGEASANQFIWIKGYPHWMFPSISPMDDHGVFPIRPNLWNFLKSMYGGDGNAWPEYIWIDAICINQEDDVEKGIQIPLMYDIYAKASRTIIWLGQGGSRTFRAMKFLARLDEVDKKLEELEAHYKRVREDRQRRQDTTLSLFEDITLSVVEKLVYLKEEGGEIFHLHCPGAMEMAALLHDNTYWHRTWIVQEVLASNALVIRLGSHELAWNCLGRFVMIKSRVEKVLEARKVARELLRWRERYGELQDLIIQDPEILGEKYWQRLLRSAAFALVDDRLRFSTGSRSMLQLRSPDEAAEDLVALVRAYRNTGCSDPRDKIYAFLGLIGWRHIDSPQKFSVDYKQSTEDLYHSVMRFVAQLDASNAARLGPFLAAALDLNIWI